MAIFTAIATAILGAGSAFIGVTAAALEIATGIAVSLIGKAMSGSNSTSASQFAVQGTLQAGGDIERSFVIGRGAAAGSLVYANEWGNVDQTPNAYHTQVICLSDLPVAGSNAAGLSQLFVNGVLCPIDWAATPATQGYPVIGYNKGGKDHLWIKFYDGTQTAADSFLTSTFATASPVTIGVTMTIASPCVVTSPGHGLAVGGTVVFSTTDTLPTGVTAGTTYYVIAAGFTVDEFEFSATSGGSAINTSGSQAGTQTAVRAGRAYGSDRIGTGCAYAIVTALVNDNLFSGFPTYKFALLSTPLYDISKDSTAGGSGSHRFADKSTWGGDGDYLPAVQIYNILRGITYNGAWFYGLQNLPGARLPNASWVAAVNKCRATITGPAGSEPTYRSGGEAGVNATIADTITTLLTTCQGRLTEVGGTYTLQVGAPGSSVFSFTDDQILSTEQQTFTPFFGLADTINGIMAKYPDPDSGWNSVVAPPLYNTAFEAQDGSRRLLSDVSLDFVPFAGQVQRLMQSALLEARRARRHTFVLPPEAWVLEPGDIIDYTSTRNGYAAKLFRVDGIADKANLDVIVDLTEVDPSDYDWDQSTDFHAPVTGNLVPQHPTAQPMTGWSASPAAFDDDDGVARHPSINVTASPHQPDVQAVRVQVRLTSSAAVVFDGEVPYDDTLATPNWTLNGTFLANTDYQVRGKFIPASSNRTTLWSNQDSDGVDGAWLDVTTPVVVSDNVTNVQLSQLSNDLQSIIGLVFGNDAGSVTSLITALKSRIAAQAAANLDDQATNKEKTTVLSVQTASATAAVITEETARIEGDLAEATARTEAIAAIGNAVADGNILFDSIISDGGAKSTISIKVRAQTGDIYADSGIMIVASSDGLGGTTSQIVLKTDKLYVTDGTNVNTALTFDTATGAITAAQLLSPDGLFDINLTGKSIHLEG